MIDRGDIGKLAKKGDVQALEMLSTQGKWEECLEIASNHSEESLNTYLMRFSKQFLQQGQFKETARVVTKYGCPAI